MKRPVLFAHAVMLSFVFLAQPCHSIETPNDDFPYYVIIGAFASRTNAENFTLQAKSQRPGARFEMNRDRNLYYVFITKTSNREEAVHEVLRLREESPYKDAWVYNGGLGDEKPIVSSLVSEEIHPVSTAASETAQLPEAPLMTERNEKSETQADKAPATTASNLIPVGSDLTAEELADKQFIFQAYRATDNKLLDADIEVVDVDRSRRMHTFKSNMPVAVTIPNTKTGSVLFICQSFGYRKTQKDFSFKAPSTDSLFQDDAGNLVVPFELIRLQKGDIAVMYNVFYFKDAAIMRPESRYEVNNLLQMLNENPDYKIKLHGHTNGNAAGKIITMGESQDLFSLNNSNDGFGSAKKLSEERAKAIRDYLYTNGIAQDRIEVKAWGGKRPIHDKHSARAQENIRVEVEILDH